MRSESKIFIDLPSGPLMPLEFAISNEMLQDFIELTGDRSSLHTDPSFARRSMYRRNVVHGMLPLAYLACLSLPPDYRYSIESISGRFLRPLFLGDRLSLVAGISTVRPAAQEIELEYALNKAETGATLTTGHLLLAYARGGCPDNDDQSDAASKAGSCLLIEPVEEQTLRLDQIQPTNEQHLLFRVTEDCLPRFRRMVASGLASAQDGWKAMGRLKHFDLAGLLTTCLLSTFVGMRLPGRYATFADFRMVFARPVQWRKLYKLKGRVRFKSASASAVVQDVSVHEAGNESDIYAAGKIGARVNAAAPEMPTARSLRQDEVDLQLRNKVILVTGASRGIGETIAKLFAAFDAKVIVNYFQGKADAERVVDEIIDAGGEALALQADVSDAQQVKRMISAIRDRYSTVHVAVNNAVRDAYPVPFMELTWSDIQKDIDVTVRGAFNCCQEVLPLMMANGGGKIINVATVYTENPQPSQAKYVISKSAMIGLTRSLAVEFAQHNIQVNLVVPSIAETDLTGHMPKIFLEEMKSRTPMRRHATPSDVAKAVVVLASSLTSFTTGQKLMVTGGNPPFL